MLYIVIATAAVYIFDMMDTTRQFIKYLYFNMDLIRRGQLWRLFSFVFIPIYDDRPLFFAISLYFYYFIGSSLEDYWGKAKFTIYYIFGVVFTLLYGVAVHFIFGDDGVGLSAVYINLSMFFAFAVLFPDVRVLLLFIIPVKIKWLALVDAAFFVFAVITTPFPMNILPIIAILNFALFFFDDLIRLIKGMRASNSRASAKFRSSVHAAKREEANREYRHKCAVCGKTDVDNPGMEFRYCSRCAGYHCFCEEHINSHVHFTED